MKEICKNCKLTKPTYKGVICTLKNKKVKHNQTCEGFQPKR
jgi:hypothetical protein